VCCEQCRPQKGWFVSSERMTDQGQDVRQALQDRLSRASVEWASSPRPAEIKIRASSRLRKRKSEARSTSRRMACFGSERFSPPCRPGPRPPAIDARFQFSKFVAMARGQACNRPTWALVLRIQKLNSTAADKRWLKLNVARRVIRRGRPCHGCASQRRPGGGSHSGVG